MLQSEPRISEMDALGHVVRTVERKLGLTMLVLALGAAAILAFSFGQPLFQYVAGPEIHFSAAADGAGCGAHLEWVSDSESIEPGSTATFTNNADYWQIPVAIDRRGDDGSWERVAESSRLRDGESWTHTFWRGGEYRITSSDDVLLYAGLNEEIVVE